MTTTEYEPRFEVEFSKICQEARQRHDEQMTMFAAIEAGEKVEYMPFGSLNDMMAREDDVADRLLTAALDEFRDVRSMTYEMFSRITTYTGRKYGPRVLYVLDMFDALATDTYASAVPSAWGLAEFPGTSLERKAWRALWVKAGFTIDLEPAARPTEPVRVWRASWPKFKGNMSWTADKSRAEWFVQARSGNMRLYTALVPPERLLGRIHAAGRSEDEWIVDTRGVQITEVKVDPAQPER